MPRLTFTGSLDGPILDVIVSPSIYYQQHVLANGSTLPTTAVRLLLDTGSTHCLVDEDFLSPVIANMMPTGGSLVSGGASGQTQVRRPRHALSLLIGAKPPPHGWLLGAVSVTSADSGSYRGKPFQGLLGRDVLDRAVLVYDGPARSGSLSW